MGCVVNNTPHLYQIGCVVNATPGQFYPRERDPVTIAQGADWTPGPVWTGAKYLVYIKKKCVPFMVSSTIAIVNGVSRHMQALCVIMLLRSGTR